MRKFIIIFCFLIFPNFVYASVECSFEANNSKSSYVPGEIISFNMGLEDLEDKTIKSLEYYLKYDTTYLEIQGDYSFIKSEDNINYISIKREIDDINSELDVQFKIKHKVPSSITTIEILNDDAYKSNVVNVLEEENEDLLYCNQKSINIKIDNKKDDAFLSKVKLTFIGNKTRVEEIVAFDSLDLVIDSDVTSVFIETICSGENCIVNVDEEVSIVQDYTEIPIEVETENSIRKYYLRLTKNEKIEEDDTEEISNIIISEEVKSYDTSLILIIFVTIVFLIISGSVIFIIYAKKKI